VLGGPGIGLALVAFPLSLTLVTIQMKIFHTFGHQLIERLVTYASDYFQPAKNIPAA
jgi:hypothetical protein